MLAWLDKLNPPQREAVLRTDGPLLVIAGAGSGKTRVITSRIAYLIEERRIAPWNILAVTFTNKAAREMRERVAALTREHEHERFSISTFHSICAGILRREAQRVGLTRHFTICDETDQRAVIKDAMKELRIEPGEIQPGQAQYIINQAKLRMLGPEDIGQIFATPFEEQYIRIFEQYQRKLKSSDACDFEDLLLYCVRIFDEYEEARRDWAGRWPYILVDEYQDTNFAQYRFLESLAREQRNLCVVGDEDQSIYSWRGANIGNLHEFQRQFPEAGLIRLEQNYRSYGNILNSAAHLIGHNRQRIGKTLWTDRGNGPPIYLAAARTGLEETLRIASLIDELRNNYGLPYREIAVFYRANSLSRGIEDRLREWAIPYRVVGGIRFYDRLEIKDLLSYLRLIVNPHNELALLRVINTPRRGLGEKTVDAIQLDARRNSRSMFIALEAMARENNLPKAAAKKAGEFAAMIQRWRGEMAQAAPSMILERVLADTGYLESLGDPQALEALTRRENIDELKNSLLQFEAEHPAGELGDYLEMVALASAVEDANVEQNCVSLMTLHAAKGLEFSTVIITALDNGIFPNQRALEESGDAEQLQQKLEEERRLFYVGMTRAKDLLVLTRADSRFHNGRQTWSTPSLFLRELPKALLRPLEEFDGAAVLEFAGLRKIPAESARAALDAETTGAAHDRSSGADATAFPFGANQPEQPRAKRQTESAGSRLPYQVGDMVRHPQLGVGEILSIEPVDGDHRVTLFLEDGSERPVYAKYANLALV